MRARILELHGLPGAGKSTLFAELSRRENLVFLGVDYFNKNGEWSLAQKFKHLISVLKLEHLKFLWYVYKLRGARYRNSLLSGQEQVINLVYLVYLYRCYGEYERTTQTVVVDEGFVQSLAVFLYGCEIDEKAFEAFKLFIKRRIPQLYLIHCRITEVESLNRIEQRNRKTARMDFFTPVELQKFVSELSLKQGQLRTLLSEGYTGTEVDLSSTVEVARNALEKVIHND